MCCHIRPDISKIDGVLYNVSPAHCSQQLLTGDIYMVMFCIIAAVRAKTNQEIHYKLHFRSCLFKNVAVSQTESEPAKA